MKLLQTISPKLLLTFILGAFIGIIGNSYFQKNILPAWADNLPFETHEAKKAFDATVKEKFAPGTDSRLMIKELQNSGFKKSWHEDNSAVHITKNITCSYKRIITWNTDKNMIITSMNGDYQATCL